MIKESKKWPTWVRDDQSVVSCTEKIKVMTENFDEIKEKLEAQPGPPPFLGYRAEVGSEVIPLAEIRVREDGVGYGGSIKFEMTLDKIFAKVLVKANSEVYSEN